MKATEYALIGTCLLDPDVFGTLTVKAEHFSDRLCSRIWEAMQRGINDPVSVCREIGSEHEHEITQMVNTSYTSAAEKYATEITAAYLKRSFLSKLVVTHRQVETGEKSIDDAISGLVTAADVGCESGYTPVIDLVVQNYLDIKARQEGTDTSRFMASGYPSLDIYTGGLERGNLVIVAGRSSMGKSALAMGICQRVAEQHAVCFSSIEMDNQSVAYRLMASISKMDLRLLRTAKVISSKAWDGLTNATEKIKTLNFNVDDNPKRSAGQIAAQARRHKQRNGLDVLMVDYLGLLDSESQKDLPRHLQVGEMTRIFKGLAKQLDCCVILLCQLNRDAEGKRPTLANLRESGSVEQDADIVLFPYRFKNALGHDDAMVIVAKNRNGPTGDAPMAWVGCSASYEPLEQGGY